MNRAFCCRCVSAWLSIVGFAKIQRLSNEWSNRCWKKRGMFRIFGEKKRAVTCVTAGGFCVIVLKSFNEVLILRVLKFRKLRRLIHFCSVEKTGIFCVELEEADRWRIAQNNCLLVNRIKFIRANKNSLSRVAKPLIQCQRTRVNFFRLLYTGGKQDSVTSFSLINQFIFYRIRDSVVNNSWLIKSGCSIRCQGIEEGSVF